jgi:hypothetical protein
MSFNFKEKAIGEDKTQRAEEGGRGGGGGGDGG